MPEIRRIGVSPKVEASIPFLSQSETEIVFSGKEIPETFGEFAKGCKIISEGEIKNFELFDWQLELAELILSGRYKVFYVIKSRQLGLSLLMACIIAYETIQNAGYNTSVISLGQQETVKFSYRVKRMIDSYDVKFAKENTREHILMNESMIGYFPNTSTGTRSESSNIQVYDEAGFYPIRQLKGASAASRVWGGDRSVSVSITTPSDKTSDFYELLSEGNPEPYEEIARKIVEGELPPFYFWVDSRGACKVAIHYTAIDKFRDNPDLYIGLLLEEGLTPDQINREANLKFDDNSGGNVISYTAVNAAFSMTDEDVLTPKQYRMNGFDIVIGVDPTGYGTDQLGVTVLAIHTRLLQIRVLEEKYFDLPEYGEMDLFLNGLNLPNGTLIFESNGVGCECKSHSRYSPVLRRHRIKEYAQTEESKIQSNSFLRWIFENGLIQGKQSLLILRDQLKKFDLNEGAALTGMDDGVMSLIHGLQFCDFSQWYCRKNGINYSSGVNASRKYKSAAQSESLAALKGYW